jgi:hypothetical protein
VLKEHPLLGTGAGTFRWIFPNDPAESSHSRLWNLGTDAYWVFEVAVEMGAPCALLIMMGMVPPCLSSVEAKWRENGNKR